VFELKQLAPLNIEELKKQSGKPWVEWNKLYPEEEFKVWHMGRINISFTKYVDGICIETIFINTKTGERCRLRFDSSLHNQIVHHI
jgi:hypothetical protein